MKKTHLVVIDPQNDFCAQPGAALPVPGTTADMQRLAKFITCNVPRLFDIHVTLDSHNPVDIAHPAWWVDSSGNAPKPFTVISEDDVTIGKWRARMPDAQARSAAYVKQLYQANRYALVIWPEHCLIGTWGHNVQSDVMAALNNWARNRMEVVDFVTKGSNPFTEHYSAVQAEVPDAADPSTLINTRFIETLAQADEILIAGEALSHCVANTVRDIAANFGDENIKKLVLLEDCASSVGGFEQLGRDFVAEMSARGMRVIKSTDY
jgi:nicotinamidase-related amidase